MKTIIIMFLFLFGCFFKSDFIVYVISRLYEDGFVCCQYNYLGLDDPNYIVDFSYNNKIICLKKDYDSQMQKCLNDLVFNNEKTLSKRKNKTTSYVEISDKKYIAKKHFQVGFFKNIFKMSAAVTIWNNLHWAIEKNIPVVKPVALVEKRNLFYSFSLIIYEFEDVTVNSVFANDSNVIEDIKNVINLLKEKNVIHQDLRARNMVYSKNRLIKFIDVDMMHYYPRYSYIYISRMKKEEMWLEEECNTYIL